MHIDDCPFAVRLTRWVPESLPEYPASQWETDLENYQTHDPVFKQFSSRIHAIIPDASTMEIRPPTYRHRYFTGVWDWHQDTFTPHTYMIVWANIAPTQFRITATQEEITGIVPYDVVLAHARLTEHRGPDSYPGPRWLGRAFTNTFTIEQYRKENTHV